jgi:hypothetical protein
MKRHCIVLLGLLSTAASALDRGQLPVSPVLPSMEDCRQLIATLQEEDYKRTAGESACMRQEPRFNMLPSGGHCHEGGLIAWAQCVAITNELCEFRDYKDHEVSTCFERAKQVANAGQASESAAVNVAALNAIASKGRLIATMAAIPGKLIQDPKVFLYKALGKTTPALLARAFPSLKQGITADDPDLAEQLYKYAYQHANGNLGLTRNPVIAAIQQDSLTKIDALYGSIFQQMDAALAQMKAFDSSVADMRLIVPSGQPVGHPVSGDSLECSALDDFRTASKLRDDDPDKFLALMRRCTGK